MLSGLKKMVGKNHSPNGPDMPESHLIPADSMTNLNTPSVKSAKKRKNMDSLESLHHKKK